MLPEAPLQTAKPSCETRSGDFSSPQSSRRAQIGALPIKRVECFVFIYLSWWFCSWFGAP